MSWNVLQKLLSYTKSLNRFWEKLTLTRSPQEDSSQREYMIKVISAILVGVSLLFIVVFGIGKSLRFLPLDSLILAVVLTLILSISWALAHSGYWQVASFLPPLFLLVSAIYGNIVGGPGAPAMVFYALSICLTALLLPDGYLWVATAVSILSYAGIYYAHIAGWLPPVRQSELYFWNRVIIAAISYTAIASLLRFMMSQYQAALQKARTEGERYRALVNASPDAISLIDLQGIILMTNAQALAVHQVDDVDHLIGLNVMELVEPSEVEKVHQGIQQTLQDGVIKDYVLRLKKVRENRYFPAELSGAVMLDEKGSPSGFVVITRDIEQRVQAEEALRQSEKKFRSIFDSAPIGMAITDLEGRYINVNRAYCNLLGVSPRELLGSSFTDVSVAEELEENWKARERLMKGETTVERLEKKYYRKNGSQMEAILQLTLVSDKDGKPEYFIGQVVDITELKKAQAEVNELNVSLEKRVQERTAQLEAANKELEAFAYSISHDLRAPLRSIDGFSRMLEEDYISLLDDQGKHTLERIRAASQRMGELIDSILSLSRVTRNELHISNVDLSQLAATIIEELTMQEPTRHVDVSIKEGIIVRGDEHLLRVALENLLGNAWKFTSKRELAHIIFSYEDDAEQGRIYYVRDNGAGFDMSQAHRLFTAFQRLHTASDFPGTGIGLATVQRIIHRHGGKVWAEAEPEHGTTIYFTLSPVIS